MLREFRRFDCSQPLPARRYEAAPVALHITSGSLGASDRRGRLAHPGASLQFPLHHIHQVLGDPPRLLAVFALHHDADQRLSA